MSGFPPDQIPASLQPSGTEPLSGTCPTGAPDVQVKCTFVKILRPLRQVWGLVARSCIGAVLVLPEAQSGLQLLSCPVPAPTAFFCVQLDQVTLVAPRLASPQARITFAGRNFGLAQLLIRSGRLALSVAMGPLASADVQAPTATSATIPSASRPLTVPPYSRSEPKSRNRDDVPAAPDVTKGVARG